MSANKFEFREELIPDLTSLKIESERIVLHSINENYSESIFEEFSPEITRYMFPKPAETISDTLAFISHSLDGMQNNCDLALVILKKENLEFLGCCGLHGRNNPQRPEFGIWLKKSAHGNKYGMESICALARWAVSCIFFEYAVYPVDKANISSRKIAEFLGGVVLEEKKMATMNVHHLDSLIYKMDYDELKAKCSSLGAVL